MKKLLIALIIVFYSLPAFAQEQTADKKFIFTSAFLAGATMLDVESTFAALNKCAGTCREGNPLMRPLFQSGRPAVYAVQGGVDVAVIAWSYKMKKDGNKLWWLVPVALGTAHGFAGGFNMRFVF